MVSFALNENEWTDVSGPGCCGHSTSLFQAVVVKCTLFAVAYIASALDMMPNCPRVTSSL